MAFNISWTLGFLLCPPKITTSAPSFKNSSFKFSESAKITNADFVLSIFLFVKIFASSFSLKICKLSCCNLIFSTFIFSSGPYSNAISIAFPGWFVWMWVLNFLEVCANTAESPSSNTRFLYSFVSKLPFRMINSVQYWKCMLSGSWLILAIVLSNSFSFTWAFCNSASKFNSVVTL